MDAIYVASGLASRLRLKSLFCFLPVSGRVRRHTTVALRKRGIFQENASLSKCHCSESSTALVAKGSFVFNFASYNLPTDENPAFDLDMASYGIVKVLPDGEKGATYSDMPWEPKKAFRI